MKTSNEITIHGDPERVRRRVFDLAADLQDWPALLPHYRYLRVREQSATHKIADFGAVRPFTFLKLPAQRSRPQHVGNTATWTTTHRSLVLNFPVMWSTRQELFPQERRITFQHIGGITKGMWVEWRLTPGPESVRVTIDHELHYPIPLLGAWFARSIVGRLFIHHIAGKTLQCIKTKVETEEAGGASS